jgi:RimJ/RimL family protein N-acetyltransferase
MAFQGRGIGTQMRQAICALMFDHLDAAEVTSGAFLDNPASLAVSRKVGYQPNGRLRQERRPGDLGVLQQLVLLPENFVRPAEAVHVQGVPAFRAFAGLD